MTERKNMTRSEYERLPHFKTIWVKEMEKERIKALFMAGRQPGAEAIARASALAFFMLFSHCAVEKSLPSVLY